MDVKQRIADIKNLPTTLGTMSAATVNKACDDLLLDMEIEEAIARCDYIEQARLQNLRN